MCCLFSSCTHLTQAAAAGNVSSVERVGSSAEAATSSWVSSMSAVWSHLGVVSAKGPTGKDAKEIGFDVRGE